MNKHEKDVFFKLVNYIKDSCCCDNLADPNDRSRYAGYARHSGHCSACNILKECKSLLNKKPVRL